jgi:hypothetical protein
VKGDSVKRFLLLLLVMPAGGQVAHAPVKQKPSLVETFEWMKNTLKPTEGNNVVIHRPFSRPYPKDWEDKGMDPYHSEVITNFSHEDCHVRFDVDVTDNDMGLLLGKYLVEHEVDTFDLKDIDPKSVRIQNSCEPVDTPSGPTTPFNCDDTSSRFVIFQTSDAKAKIHEESSGSNGKSAYGLNQVRNHAKDNLDEMCEAVTANGGARNPAYCDETDHKGNPRDLTSSTLGFSTPEYAKRFAKAFKHAVELCGGKQSAF